MSKTPREKDLCKTWLGNFFAMGQLLVGESVAYRFNQGDKAGHSFPAVG